METGGGRQEAGDRIQESGEQKTGDRRPEPGNRTQETGHRTQESGVSSVKVFFPTCVINKKDNGDEHKFCTTLMEKTVGEIAILNSD
jgi:hypothetical protein